MDQTALVPKQVYNHQYYDLTQDDISEPQQHGSNSLNAERVSDTLYEDQHASSEFELQPLQDNPSAFSFAPVHLSIQRESSRKQEGARSEQASTPVHRLDSDDDFDEMMYPGFQ